MYKPHAINAVEWRAELAVKNRGRTGFDKFRVWAKNTKIVSIENEIEVIER